jgi:hypothetical protein
MKVSQHLCGAIALILVASVAQAHDDDMAMSGLLGNYPMTRDASGTSWQPDSTPMAGIDDMHGEWMTMLHGYANFIYDDQGGHRGDNKAFSESMLMAMASRPVGEGTLGFRAMLSLDPLMGKSGYPLLFQTGETADGTHPLIDRQHPHDLFMELATTYSHPITENSSAFVYVGYPGEPALGPTTFMHRFSGMDDPEAPIGHHWLDATHITYGVTTLGYVYDNWKLEVSTFNGREPDQYRWGFDDPKLDSQSVRVSYNPTANWALQVSTGYIHSPEVLEPDINQQRTTASATYNLPLGKNNWQTTAAWGRNNLDPGHSIDAYLLESAFRYHEQHTFFGRAERVQKDELFEAPDPLAGQTFTINKFSLGYIYDIPVSEHVKLGLGGVGSLYDFPSALDQAYGSNPASFMLFARASLY